MILSEFKEFIFSLLYTLFKYILYLIDFIQETFYLLSGIEKVEIDGKREDILISLVNDESIKRVFYLVLIVGVIVLFILTIIAVLKSYNEERIESKGEILFKSIRSFILIATAPFVFLALIYLITSIITALNTSMNINDVSSKSSTIGSQVFIVATSKAYISDIGIKDFIESKFLSGEYSYLDVEIVKTYYDLESINYVTGLISSSLILVLLFSSIIIFIQRIFDIIFLYILSPIFISTIPLNKERHFNEYKEVLIERLISSSSIILSFNLYFLIIPKINDITFFMDSFKDNLIKIFFLIGGVYAFTKVNRVVDRVINASNIPNIKEVVNIFKSSYLGAVHLKDGFIKGEKELVKIKGKVKDMNISQTIKEKTKKLEEIIKSDKNNK